MGTSGVTADGPITMMDSTGAEIVIPLSALYIDAGVVKADHWPGFTHVQDNHGVTKWLQKLLADGTVGAAPPAQPQPAMVVRAAAPGEGGNAIAVQVGGVVTDPDPTNTSFNLAIALTQKYAGLTPTTIETVLGSDLKPLSQPGPVDVVHDSIDITKTVDTNATYTLSGGVTGTKPRLDLVDAASNPVVTLEANRSLGTTKLTVSNISATKATFSITATWAETNPTTFTGLHLSSITTALSTNPFVRIKTGTGVVLPGTVPPTAQTLDLPAATGSTMPSVHVADTGTGTAFEIIATPLLGAAKVSFTTGVAAGADFTFDMTVTQQGAVETEQFDGVTLDTIEQVLGSDIAPTAPAKLIQVVRGSVKPGAKVAGPTAETAFPVPAATSRPARVDVKNAGGQTVFALEANETDGAITVDVANSNPPANTFDMTVKWTLTAAATKIGTLSAAAAQFGGLVSVAPPPGSSFSVPAANAPHETTPLTGGGDGTSASATLFASTT